MTQLIHHATPMPETNDAFDLVGLARATARRWPIVIITPLLTIGLAHFTIPLLPVDYRASAQLLIFDPLRASTAALGRDVAPVHDLDPIAINTEVEVIRSASALRQLALTLRLDKVPEFNSLGVRQQLITLFGLDRGAPLSKAPAAGVEETGLGRAVLALGKRISVERVSLSYVVTVSASAGSPELAYRLVTGLLSNYLGDQEELSQQSLTQSADWVRDKIAEVQARASDTRAEIERLRTEGGVSQDGKATLLQQQRADLSAKLVAVRAELTERKSRLEMAAAATTAAGDDVGSSPGQLTSPALDQLRQQLSQLLRDTAQVSARFGAQHLHVIAMDDRATSLRRAIIDETARLTAEEQTNYELAQRREQALVIEVNRLGRAEMDAGVLTRLQELQRVADADAKLLDAYSGRLEKVGAAASLGNAGRRILSPASMPSAPNSPRKPLIYAGAGAAGLILGGALALLMGYRLGTIPPAGPGQNRFGHPVFGNLPLLKGRSSRRAKDKAAAAMAHAMRCIRVGLQLHTRNGNPKVVVVTSSVRGEGRTTVAAALATETARSGIRTVLVDCDLASPLGLMPIDDRWPASGELSLPALDPANLARRDPATGCYIIAASDRQPGDGLDPLAPARFREALARLTERFGFVVIDAPPLLPIPEASVMAACADAVLLVIDATASHASQVQQSLTVLGAKEGCLTGIVLNKQPPADLRRAGLVSTEPDQASPARPRRSPSGGARQLDGVAVAAERTSP